MFATIASFLGKSLLRGITEEVLAEMAGATIRQEVTEEVVKQVENPKPQIMGVDSETWYAFRMSKTDAWGHSNRFLADHLTTAIPRSYAETRGTMPTFVVSADSDQHGVIITFSKVPRTKGFLRQEAKSAAINGVRNSLRQYLRATATGTWSDS